MKFCFIDKYINFSCHTDYNKNLATLYNYSFKELYFPYHIILINNCLEERNKYGHGSIVDIILLKDFKW